MKIELKNVKYAAFASEETNCFEATVYIDGKRAGTARNEGKGGNTWIEPRALVEQLNAYGKTLPQKSLGLTHDDGTPMMYTQDAESLIDDLLTAYLNTRDVKRWLGRQTTIPKAT